MIDRALIDYFPDQHDGYPADLAAADSRDALMSACGDASREMPDALRIDRKDWADKARDNDKYKTWPLNYLDRFTNQDPSHLCTCESLVMGFLAARNRARGVIHGGPQKNVRLPTSAEACSVWGSAQSVYAEANPRQWGGANCLTVLEIAVRRGILPDKIQPRNYGFAHSLIGTSGRGCNNQSAGDWVPLSRFPEGWKETAKHFRVLEVIFPDTWEDVVSLVLNGYVVNVGRKGHAIPYTHWNHAEQLMGYVDSYEVIRWDSAGTVKSAVGGASAIATVTVPDDWHRPAG